MSERQEDTSLHRWWRVRALIGGLGFLSLVLLWIGGVWYGRPSAPDGEPRQPYLWAGLGLMAITVLAGLIAAPVTDWSGRRSAWGRVPTAEGIDRTGRSIGGRPVYETTVDDRRVTLASDPHEGGAVGSLLIVETGVAVEEFVRCEADLAGTDVEVPSLDGREPVGSLTADGDEGVLRLAVQCPEVPTDPGTLRAFASTAAGVADSIERDGLSTVEWSSRTYPRPAPSGSGTAAGSDGESGAGDRSETDGEPP